LSSDVVLALEPVVAALEGLGVAYRIGGFVASSALGVPRSTLDVDVVCALGGVHVDAFVRALSPEYYVDADMIRDAIARRASFNLIHLATMLKVDVFVRGAGDYDREVFARVTRRQLDEGTREFDLTTAEDIVLRKLEWFRSGGGVSERHWTDVLGVIRVQSDALDREYLAKWAAALGLAELLERALREADDLAR
jgi:hypothetical protein